MPNKKESAIVLTHTDIEKYAIENNLIEAGELATDEWMDAYDKALDDKYSFKVNSDRPVVYVVSQFLHHYIYEYTNN